jgi:hypothetical protein
MKWKIIQNIGKENIPNLYKLIQFVLSIPGSNAFVERVFSLMNLKWTDSRNKCSADLIKSEIIISKNVIDTCKDYFVRVEQNRQILEAAKSNKKYSFKS